MRINSEKYHIEIALNRKRSFYVVVFENI